MVDFWVRSKSWRIAVAPNCNHKHFEGSFLISTKFPFFFEAIDPDVRYIVPSSTEDLSTPVPIGPHTNISTIYSFIIHPKYNIIYFQPNKNYYCFCSKNMRISQIQPPFPYWEKLHTRAIFFEFVYTQWC